MTVTVHLAEGTDPTPVVAMFERGDIDAAPVGLRKVDGRVLLSGEVTAPPPTLLLWMTELSSVPGVETIDDE